MPAALAVYPHPPDCCAAVPQSNTHTHSLVARARSLSKPPAGSRPSSPSAPPPPRTTPTERKLLSEQSAEATGPSLAIALQRQRGLLARLHRPSQDHPAEATPNASRGDAVALPFAGDVQCDFGRARLSWATLGPRTACSARRAASTPAGAPRSAPAGHSQPRTAARHAPCNADKTRVETWNIYETNTSESFAGRLPPLPPSLFGFFSHRLRAERSVCRFLTQPCPGSAQPRAQPRSASRAGFILILRCERNQFLAGHGPNRAGPNQRPGRGPGPVPADA